MSARDHDLAQAIAADEPAITVSASPPPRNSVEDADASFTRKRPRLDSGSNSIRAMSADPSPPAQAAASPAEQQVEMTIRPHPPSSPAPAQDGHGSDAPHFLDDPQLAQSDSPVPIASTEDEPGSPPVMIIDDDDEADDAFSVQLDAEDHFRQFPYAHLGSYSHVVREIPQHIQASSPIEGQLLPLLSDWLNDLPDTPVDVQGYFVSKAVFWDDFGTLVNKLLVRRYPFGDHFGDDAQTDIIFYRFFRAYVRLCSFLFLADVHLLSRPRSDHVYPSPLLSQKHIQFLHKILRPEKTPVFHVLHKDYDANVQIMATRLHKDFLKANGAQNLLRLADQVFHQVPPNTQNVFAAFASQLLSTLGWTIVEQPGADAYIERPEYCRGVLMFFQKYDRDLQDPGKAADVNGSRDLIQYYATLLHELCRWDDNIAAELVDQLLELGDPDSPTSSSPAAAHTTVTTDKYRQDPACFPTLVMNAWRFKILRKYIVKGNMNLRVMALATMDLALVEIWKDFNSIDPSCRHPVMQYLADFLLQGRLVDYIVSVDSHPQLISRSGNIVGFLVVTHRWSDKQADAIWRTVSTSPDPRVVIATISMLRNIIGLMKPSAHLYLCMKLHDLPIDRYTLDILRFLRDLSVKLSREAQEPVDFDERGPTARPWNVCIRMIRDTAPSRDADKNLLDLFAEANDQLHYWASTIPPHDRHTIYRECAQHIADRTSKATGSVRVIFFLASPIDPRDGNFFQQNQDLTRSILEETPSFVKVENDAGPYRYQMQALHCRLELLRLTICHPGMDIPTDLYEELWDHVVGEHALSNEARDLAWAQLLETIKESPGNEFCKQLILSYVPTMHAHLYTLGLFEFVACYKFPTTRRKDHSEQGEESLLQIPGAELLWSMILLSPTGIIADRAARLLAARYVEIVDEEGIMLSEVEDAHVALVEQCMQELRAALEMQPRQYSEHRSTGTVDSTDDAQSRQTTEVRLGRVLLFQKLLLEYIRRKPQFNRGRRIDSKVDAMETDIPFGDAVTIRYQCGNDRLSVTMASDHTLDDLYRRLCHATGYTNVNLFARGQRLKPAERGILKVSEIDFGGQVIVQRADGAETTRPASGPIGGSSIFESAIVKHFDELFSWMDSDNTTSHLLFDFLSSFPARGTFADSVAKDGISSEELFPPGKVYQARYAAQDLQARLREQIRSSTMNEIFLSCAVQHLDKALLNVKLISDPTPSLQELELAAVLVRVLLEFLRERPSPEISAGYFSNSPSLVDRLMSILLVAIDTPDFATLAKDSYAAILEASLHSRAIWEAFIHHPDANRVHQALLLAQPNHAIRQSVSQKIASICGGDLPSTCPVTKAETAARFWTLLSAILPEAVQYPGQSQQLFEIAEHVFRTNDEYDRNEESLRSSLTQWSTLLLDHEHKQFPGREETDHVVLGLTKLLLGCLISLKSFKKPVNAGSLMTQVFRKYIFVNSTEAGNKRLDDVSLPILASHTRQELYDLMLGLVEDRNTYGTLLQLTGEVEHEVSGPVLSSNLVDRSAEIRSSTGYVGLYNPRAICYMNSLLTQLFMNLNFREFILGLEVKEAKGSQRLLFETQRLFAQMQNSFRKSTDPRDFAACVKSLDKTPIDITIQMDADEFYNLLFDQWEAQLLKQEHKQRFRSFYGGQILNQIKSKECEHVSERAEPFFAVQCDVQGKANLQESLQAYVQGDVMEGDNKYKCESCDGKFVDAVKRTCLKLVPDNLIFHLKRFEFDLNDFSRRKIYDHFAFPETLDISPYKIDHLADPSQPCKEDVFDLVGVLVHTGTCENGHYYSYIRERPCPDGTVTPTWIEFNDSDVGPFNPVEIAERAFGGLTDGEAYARQTKPFSAYMLFYQRRTAINDDQHHWIASASDQSPRVAVPKPFEEETNVNNELFIREYCLFDPIHARFLRQLHATSRTVNHGTCTEDHEQETKALHIILAHLGHIAWRHYNTEVFLELLVQLRRSMLSCSTCCDIALKWLAADDHALTNILIKCGHPKIRSQMRTLLLDSLKYLREKEPALYGIGGMDSDMEVDSSTSSEGVLVALTSRLRTTADETKEGIRGWDDYYLTLSQIAEMGHMETATLLNLGFLEFCLKLFCMQQHQPFNLEAPELARIMEKRRFIFNRLIGFVWKLLLQMDLRLQVIDEHQSQDRQATFDREVMKFPLARHERTLLLWYSDDIKANVVLDKMLEVFDDTKVEHFYPGDIFKWMLQSPDNAVQTNLLRTIVEGLQIDPPYCDAYVRVALPFCEACPRPDNIVRVITAVSKAIGSSSRAVEDHSPGGIAVLGFFAGLLKAKNDILFEQKHPHAFHHYLMFRSRTYGIALLCHYDDIVREAAQSFFQQLYNNEEDVPPETVHVKFASIRSLLPEMMHKFVYEKEVGRHRSFLNPLLDTCRLFVEQLYYLTQNQEPEAQQLQDANDAALIYQYQQEIETRLRVWTHDEGTPLSAGEAFDQSDYGSESDDGHDLLEN